MVSNVEWASCLVVGGRAVGQSWHRKRSGRICACIFASAWLAGFVIDAQLRGSEAAWVEGMLMVLGQRVVAKASPQAP